jgi:serine protease
MQNSWFKLRDQVHQVKSKRSNKLYGIEKLETRQVFAADTLPIPIAPDQPPAIVGSRIPGEIVIGFKQGTTAEDIRGIASAKGLKNLQSLYMGGDPRPVQSAKIPEHAMAKVMQALRNNPRVEYVEHSFTAAAFFTPNDPLLNLQWNLQSSSTGSINAVEAWQTTTGSGAVVAVLDTGVAFENRSDSTGTYYVAPDLAGTRFVAGYDFVNNDPYANDDNSHGTHVAGTIAQSTNNGLGVAGVASDASIMPVKVLGRDGSGSHAAIAQGVRWAVDNGAQVINLSLGSSSGSTTLRDALAYAYGKGATIVAAAGNNGQNAVSFPAAYDDFVIAVSATRFDENLAPYSNYGSSIDIAAPGGDTSVNQNGDQYVDGILQNTFNPSTKNTADFGYYFFQGTSMAAPHVAGVAALVTSQLLKIKGTVDPTTVRNILQSTARDRGTAGVDSLYGYGILDAAAAVRATLGISNAAPIAVADSASTIQGQPIRINVLANDSDPDGDSLNLVSVSAPDRGAVVINSDKTVTYTPPAGFVGPASFSYTIADAAGLTSTASVSVNNQPTPIVRVTDLDATVRTNNRRQWQAVVAVQVQSGTGVAVANASVSIRWSDGRTATATTNSLGQVTFGSAWLSSKTSSLTFSITKIVATGYAYDATKNEDREGDSNGTSVRVNRNGTTSLSSALASSLRSIH